MIRTIVRSCLQRQQVQAQRELAWVPSQVLAQQPSLALGVQQQQGQPQQLRVNTW